MATASFGKWRNYYNKAWFSEKDNTSSSNTNFTDNMAGYGAWSVVKITTGAVTGGNKLGTMTVKIGLGKYRVSPVYPTIYLSKTAYGSGNSPTDNIDSYSPSNVSFASATSVTEVTCTFDCSSLSATSAHTLYLWVGGGDKYFYAKRNKQGVTWSISLTHTMSTRSVSYNSNGGSGTMGPYSVTYNGTHKVQPNSFTAPKASSKTYTITLNPNYIGGSNDSKTVTNKIPKKFSIWRQGSTSGTERSPGTEINNITSNITLYAIWVNDTTQEGTVVLGELTRNDGSTTGYEVSFDTQGGSSVSSITSTRKITYTHNGWMTSASGTEIAYNKTDAHSFTADTELFAKWTEKYTNNSIKLPDAPTKLGYKFLGWGTSPSQTSNLIAAGAESPEITTKTTYYAIWKADGSIRIYTDDTQKYKIAMVWMYYPTSSTDSKPWKLVIPYMKTSSNWKITAG